MSAPSRLDAAGLESSRFDSEDRFLRCLDRFFPNRAPGLLLGRGDDCCLFETPGKLLLSADLFLENQHFRRSYFSPADIGWKALAVNLSDIAAMGGRPLGFCLALMAPPGLPVVFWEELFAGMAALAHAHALPLVGGDLSAADSLGLSITIWGAPGARVLKRRADLGDALFVAEGGAPLPHSRLGLARVGLLALERYGPEAARRFPEAVTAHLRPTPLLAQGALLAANSAVRGLMDLSDGLARDLPRLWGQEQRGAALRLRPEELHPELLDYAAQHGLDPLETAVLGGEDYVLCGALDGDAGETLPGLRRIGRVTDKPGIFLNGAPFRALGFDHFAGA